WLCPDWDTAVADVRWLTVSQKVREVHVGASLLSSMPQDLFPRPERAGTAETRVALPLLRDLAAGGTLAHDETTGEPRHEEMASLDDAIAAAQVKHLQAGLSLTPDDSSHLVKTVCWAVN